MPIQCPRSLVLLSTIGAAFLLFSLRTDASPGVSPSAENKGPDMTAYNFAKHKEKAGETNRYQIAIKIHPGASAGPASIIVHERFKTTIRDAKPDGEITLLNEFETGTVSFSGSEQDILRLLPIVTIYRDRSGHFSAKAQGGSAEGNPEVLAVMQQIAASPYCLLPGKAIHVGDKWPLAFDNANTMIGGSRLEGEAELVDTEEINGVKTLKINFKTTDAMKENATADKNARGHSEGTLSVDVQGRIIRLVQKGDGKFAGSPAIVEIELELHKPTNELKP